MYTASRKTLYLVLIVSCGIILNWGNPVRGFEVRSTKNFFHNSKEYDSDIFRHQRFEVDDTERSMLGDGETKLERDKSHFNLMDALKSGGGVDKYSKYPHNAEKSSSSIRTGKSIDRIPIHSVENVEKSGSSIRTGKSTDRIPIHSIENVEKSSSSIRTGKGTDRIPILSKEPRNSAVDVNLHENVNFEDELFEDVAFHDAVGATTNASEIVYTAAVLEFEAYRDWTEGGSEAIYERNVHSFEFYAAQAKLMGADVLVFPEYGLEGLDHNTRNESVFQALTLPVPAPSDRVAPCDFVGGDAFDPMQKLSCLARRLEMYLVVDLAEKAQTSLQDGGTAEVYYNTQAVFDRNGVVVARYRKRHLFQEPNFRPGPDPDEAALFTTDFGVTFSLQICFDILFGEPSYANVRRGLTRDIITSTAWIDHAPFNLAPNVQNGFSRSLGANLLVANYHWPEMSKLGSGVYHGYSNLSHVYTYDEHSGNVLVVSPVRTVLSEPPQRIPHSFLSRPRVLKYRRSSDAVRHHNIEESPKRLMKSSDILNTTLPHVLQQSHVSVCFRDFCCNLNYHYFTSNKLNYRLVAYSGYYPAGNRLLYTQVCGLLWCQTEEMDSCNILEPQPTISPDFFGPFTLSGNFSSDVTFPSAMMRNFTLVANQHYGFKEETSGYSEIEFNAGVPNLAMTYIFGRKYSADLP